MDYSIKNGLLFGIGVSEAAGAAGTLIRLVIGVSIAALVMTNTHPAASVYDRLWPHLVATFLVGAVGGGLLEVY